MGKKDKREQKIRDNIKNVSLEDFEWLINQYGYRKSGGNHCEAIIGRESYPYPKKNPMPRPYVEGLLEIIDKRR
jgi:hypothetical protein